MGKGRLVQSKKSGGKKSKNLKLYLVLSLSHLLLYTVACRRVLVRTWMCAEEQSE